MEQQKEYYMETTAIANKEKIERLQVTYKELAKKKDVRGVIRTKALIAYFKGVLPDVIAQCYDVNVKTVNNWVKRFEEGGPMDDLPRSGRPSKLTEEQQTTLKQMIIIQNQRVWTARHVFVLLTTVFSVCYSIGYLPQLLRSLGLSFHKAVHQLVKKDNKKRRIWFQETLLNLYADKVKEGWRIFFQDEVGFQTEGTLTYSWGQKGEKIEIKNYGRHGRVNLLGAFELGTGNFYGVLTKFCVNACRFRRFLCHLKREMSTDKLILICDNARFHKAKWLNEWLKEQTSWIRLEFLPAYSPDFNPIERLWRWIKSEYIHNRCWESQTHLETDLKQMLQELVKRKSELTGVMRQEIKRLKQVFEFYETPCPFLVSA